MISRVAGWFFLILSFIFTCLTIYFTVEFFISSLPRAIRKRRTMIVHDRNKGKSQFCYFDTITIFVTIFCVICDGWVTFYFIWFIFSHEYKYFKFDFQVHTRDQDDGEYFRYFTYHSRVIVNVFSNAIKIMIFLIYHGRLYFVFQQSNYEYDGDSTTFCCGNILMSVFGAIALVIAYMGSFYQEDITMEQIGFNMFGIGYISLLFVLAFVFTRRMIRMVTDSAKLELSFKMAKYNDLTQRMRAHSRQSTQENSLARPSGIGPGIVTGPNSARPSARSSGLTTPNHQQITPQISPANDNRSSIPAALGTTSLINNTSISNMSNISQNNMIHIIRKTSQTLSQINRTSTLSNINNLTNYNRNSRHHSPQQSAIEIEHIRTQTNPILENINSNTTIDNNTNTQDRHERNGSDSVSNSNNNNNDNNNNKTHGIRRPIPRRLKVATASASAVGVTIDNDNNNLGSDLTTTTTTTTTSTSTHGTSLRSANSATSALSVLSVTGSDQSTQHVSGGSTELRVDTMVDSVDCQEEVFEPVDNVVDSVDDNMNINMNIVHGRLSVGRMAVGSKSSKDDSKDDSNDINEPTDDTNNNCNNNNDESNENELNPFGGKQLIGLVVSANDANNINDREENTSIQENLDPNTPYTPQLESQPDGSNLESLDKSPVRVSIGIGRPHRAKSYSSTQTRDIVINYGDKIPNWTKEDFNKFYDLNMYLDAITRGCVLITFILTSMSIVLISWILHTYYFENSHYSMCISLLIMSIDAFINLVCVLLLFTHSSRYYKKLCECRWTSQDDDNSNNSNNNNNSSNEKKRDSKGSKQSGSQSGSDKKNQKNQKDTIDGKNNISNSNKKNKTRGRGESRSKNERNNRPHTPSGSTQAKFDFVAKQLHPPKIMGCHHCYRQCCTRVAAWLVNH